MNPQAVERYVDEVENSPCHIFFKGMYIGLLLVGKKVRMEKGQGRPLCRVLKNPDQRKTNLSEKSALVNLLLCDFWIWFGF